MNKVEEFVYHLVYRNPKLKLAIRNIYQGCYDMLPRQKEFFAGKYYYKDGYFLGFHDTNPFSDDETKVLANEEYFDGRMPKAGEKIGVGFFDFADGKLGDFHKLDDCYAWNWHKGCRSQWLSDDEVIFNTAKNNHVVSEIVNVKTGEKRFVDYPIDTALVVTNPNPQSIHLSNSIYEFSSKYADNGQFGIVLNKVRVEDINRSIEHLNTYELNVLGIIPDYSMFSYFLHKI